MKQLASVTQIFFTKTYYKMKTAFFKLFNKEIVLSYYRNAIQLSSTVEIWTQT